MERRGKEVRAEDGRAEEREKNGREAACLLSFICVAAMVPSKQFRPHRPHFARYGAGLTCRVPRVHFESFLSVRLY